MSLINHLRCTLVFVLILLFTPKVHSQLRTLNTAQETLESAEKIVAKTSEYVGKINAAVDLVQNKDLYKTLVDGKEFSFPVGILPASGDKNYALVINGVSMTPEGMFAEIFMRIPISSDRALYFLADKVPFSRSGGIAGDLKLYLLRTDSIKVGTGYSILFDGLEQGGTEKSCFVTFNCKGFKDATLSGAVNFNKSSIVKDKASQEQVSVKYHVQADKLSNFIIKLDDIPTFEFTNLPGFKCSVNSILLDKSEIKNDPDFSLPSWYIDSIQTQPGLANYDVAGVAWEGIYIPEIVLEIPKAFKEDNPEAPVVITSRHFIIDQNGVTGLNSATNVLDGKIKGWKYSIDTIRVNLIASSLSQAGIYGELSMPISGEESTVGYGLLMTKAVESPDISYSGYLDIERNGGLVDVQSFGVARIKLDHARFEFDYANDQFYPAVLIEEGSLTLAPKSNGDSESSFASFGMDICKLRVTSRQPYLSIGDGGFVKMSGTGNVMANFPVGIDSVGLKQENGGQRIGLFLSLSVRLQKTGGDSEGSSGFGGNATFTVWTKRDPVVKKWQYDDFQLDRIVVNVNNSSFSLYGELSTFENDVVYGTGFCGYLDLKVIKKIEVKAGAIFGREGKISTTLDAPPMDAAMQDSDSEYRYWFVDAAATFPVLPVAPFVGINGFTGGLYHHMAMDKDSAAAATTTVSCSTATGITYVPDRNIFMGLIAGVGLQSIPTAAVFNGDITLGLEFNYSGGLNMVALWGGVTLLTPEFTPPKATGLLAKMEPTNKIDQNAAKSKVPEESSGSLRVTWFTQYDVPNKTFIGDFDIYVSLYGVVNGSHEAGKAGHIAVLFSPAAKYVYIGTPVEPIGLNVINLFECTSYFCAGNTLPNPPIAPLPPEVDAKDINYSSLETGAGLSFGARVEVGGRFGVEIEKLTCKVWVGAEVWAKSGFDVLISKSNHPIYCGSSGPRGINNWYATGQAFIAGGFRLGLDYDCAVGSGSKNLLSASVSAYLFAQLPKPSYVKGEARVEFEIIGKKLDASIPVKFGEPCEQSEADKNIVFISSILPDSASTDVKVTQQVIVNFAKPIEQFEFILPDEASAEGAMISYRGTVNINEIILSHNGKTIPCEYEWTSSNTVLRLTPFTVLPENADIKLDVKVRLQYKAGGNWVNSSKVEAKTVIFKTGVEPVKIDISNIAYSYPLPGMNNYYRMESNSGYIKLNTLPVKPFQLAPDWSYNVVFEESGTEVTRVRRVTVDNNVGVEQFSYLIPNDQLQNGKTYTLKVVKAPPSSQEKEEDIDRYSIGYTAESHVDTVIMEYDFTTSRFNSFSQKVAYYNQSKVEISGSSVVQNLQPNQRDMTNGSAEGFSEDETSGYSVHPGLRLNKLIQSLGADFSSGFTISGNVPDSVRYSYYGGKMVISYDVFAEIEMANRSDQFNDIVCSISGSSADCSGSSSTPLIFPAGKYFYKLGYFLPGRNTKTSEVSMSLDLQQPVNIGL